MSRTVKIECGISFRLRETGVTKPTPITRFVEYNGQPVVKIPTGTKVHPAKWNPEKERPIGGQYTEQHRYQLRHATEGLVVTVALLLAYDAFDIDSGGYFQELFQNRLSDKIYFLTFTHVVVYLAKQTYNFRE